MNDEKRKRIYSAGALLLMLILLGLLSSDIMPAGLSSFCHYAAVSSQDMTGAALRVLCRLVPGSKEIPFELDGNLELNSRDELLAEIEECRLKLHQAEQAKEPLAAENQRLNSLLKLSLQTRRYSLCVARPVRREPLSNYYETMLIDKGTSDGIREGQAVVTEAGLVGVVSHVEPRRSEVQLLGNQYLTFSVRVPSRQIDGIATNRRDYIAKSDESEEVEGLKIIETDDERPVPRLIFPPSNLQVSTMSGLNFDTAKAGDRVETSSLGNQNLLDGILVGTVERIETDTAGAPRLQVRPSADIRQLSYVLVAIPSTDL